MKKCCSVHDVHTLRTAVGITMLVLLMVGSTNAAIITVNASGGGDYDKIQDAIDNASAGDTILVYGGIYYENVNITKHLTLRGIGNPVVDARTSGSAITLAADGITLEEFTASGGWDSPDAGIKVTSSNNTLSRNNASNNYGAGIFLDSSGNNTLSDNVMTGNPKNFDLDGDIDSDFDNHIDKTNLVDGKPVYYIKGATDIVYDSSINAGTFYCINCVNVTIKNLNLNKNGKGIYFWNTSQSRIQNVNASNNGNGIYLSSSNNNTLTGNDATNNYHGISMLSSSNNMLSGNNAPNNWEGISLSFSSNNMLSGNNASDNGYSGNGAGIFLNSSSNNTLNGNYASKYYYGIYLSNSSNNRLFGNNASNNGNSEEGTGIFLDSSGNNTLSDNIMTGNPKNFDLDGHNDTDFENHIDKSNLVDGRPIYYIIKASDMTYDSPNNAGTFYCISCINVTIKNLNFNKNGKGIYFWNTSQSRIQNISASNNYNGISLSYSSNNMLSDNKASKNPYATGISLSYSSNNTLSGNKASNNWNGISLSFSSKNKLIGNKVSNNYGSGILLSSSSNNTLIGNNANFNSYSSGEYTGGTGISLYLSSNNTLSDNKASNNFNGIVLSYSSNNTLSGNKALNNIYGTSLYSSSKSVLINNIMKGNNYNFKLERVPPRYLLEGSSDSDFDNHIDKTNLVDGKPVYYIKGAKNIVYDSSMNAGTFYCISCVNVTLKNLDLKSNGNGIFFWNTSQSRIQNVTASNNGNGISLYSSSNNRLSENNVISNYGSEYGYFGYGIYLSSSRNNTLTGNNASNNGRCGLFLGGNNNILRGNNVRSNYEFGIFLDGSSKNTLSYNNVLNNNVNGINLYYSSKNTLVGNNASNNYIGISLYSSSKNKIYNNIFNNTENVNFYDLDPNINNWNTTRQSGTNIFGGSFLGGNFWGNPEGTGFSQTCKDVNVDGICDKSYSLDENNIDYLPLAKDKIPPKSVRNLKNVSYASSYINWTWKDPKDIDFKKVMVFIDDKFKRNVSKGKQYYNATKFKPKSRHTISTRTVDMNGNINKTWTNRSAWTAK